MRREKDGENRARSLRGTAMVLAAALLVLAGGTLYLSRERGAAGEEKRPDFSMPTPEPTATPVPVEKPEGPETKYGTELPFEIENGKLIVTALFTSDLMNPDAGNAYGTKVPAVQVQNATGEHLKRLELKIRTNGGETLNFVAVDIPAGRSVQMFETSNRSVDEDTVVYASVECTSVFEAETPVRPEDFSFSAKGTKVTVENLTMTVWSNLAVDFHTLVDEENGVYYGGRTVRGTVKTLKGKASAMLDMLDCYMGTAEAVRVQQGT